MPARKPPAPDEKPQRERFIETAQKIGASEDPEEFEQAFRKVVIRTPRRKTNRRQNRSYQIIHDAIQESANGIEDF